MPVDSGVSTVLVASTFLVSAQFWCQLGFGVSTFLVPARLWCQPISGASSISGASLALVSAHF
jgi:hypothetical protein